MRFNFLLSLLVAIGASPAVAHDSEHPHAHFEWVILAAFLIVATVLVGRKLWAQARIRAKAHRNDSEL